MVMQKNPPGKGGKYCFKVDIFHPEGNANDGNLEKYLYHIKIWQHSIFLANPLILKRKSVIMHWRNMACTFDGKPSGAPP